MSLRSASDLVLSGRGLFGGDGASVRLRRSSGPVELNGLPLDQYTCVRSARTTTLSPRLHAPPDGARKEIRCVEHLLAALGGLGLHRGVSIEVDGGEVPFVDGGASAFCEALGSLGVTRVAPRLEVKAAGDIDADGSVYRFRPAPRRSVSVAVTLDYPDSHLSARAEWSGNVSDFVERIAPARTFIFADELTALAQTGFAFHADPKNVILIDEAGLHTAGSPARVDEPARHKVLDLIGDLFFYGGPPFGSIEAHRPGHARTHEVMNRALGLGIVAALT